MTVTDNKVNVVTTSAGYASLAAALNAINDDASGSVGDNESFVFVFGNSTTSKVELWVVTDSGTAADNFADVVASELCSTSVALTGIAAGFAYTSFEVVSLG